MTKEIFFIADLYKSDLNGGAELVNEEVILFGSAAATSMMTIVGIAILLAPVLIRTWKEFKTAR